VWHVENFLNILVHSFSPTHSLPVSAPRCTAQSAGSSICLFQSQRSARLARHRQSDGSIAGTSLKMPSAAFQIGVVGLYPDQIAKLVKINGSCLFSLGKSCSHKTSCFLQIFFCS